MGYQAPFGFGVGTFLSQPASQVSSSQMTEVSQPSGVPMAAFMSSGPISQDYHASQPLASQSQDTMHNNGDNEARY